MLCFDTWDLPNIKVASWHCSAYQLNSKLQIAIDYHTTEQIFAKVDTYQVEDPSGDTGLLQLFKQ